MNSDISEQVGGETAAQNLNLRLININNSLSFSDPQKSTEDNKKQEDSKVEEELPEIPEYQIDTGNHCQLFQIVQNDEIMDRIESILQKDHYKPPLDDSPKRSYNLHEDLSIMLMMRKKKGYLGYDFTGYGPKFFQALQKHGFINRTSQSLRDRYKRNLKALQKVNIERIVNWIEKNESLDAFLFFKQSASGQVFAQISRQDPITIKQDKYFGRVSKYDDDDEYDFEDSEFDEVSDVSGSGETQPKQKLGLHHNHHINPAVASLLSGLKPLTRDGSPESDSTKRKRGRPRKIRTEDGEEKIDGETKSPVKQNNQMTTQLRQRRINAAGQAAENEGSGENYSHKMSILMKYGFYHNGDYQDLFNYDVREKKEESKDLYDFLKIQGIIEEPKFVPQIEDNLVATFNIETKKLFVEAQQKYQKKRLENFFQEQMKQFNLSHEQLTEIMDSINWDFDDFEILLENQNFNSQIRWTQQDDQTLKQCQTGEEDEFFKLRQHKGDDRIIKRAQYLHIDLPPLSKSKMSQRE